MIPQVPDIKTANKTKDEILDEVVQAVNLLGQQVQLALQNIDMSDVVTEMGVSLEVLLNSGALKGNPGEQGPPGQVWLPSVSGTGIISWRLTDAGGQQPATQNISGPAGPAGAKGEPGAGVPSGGTAGQVLSKKSDADFDCEWISQR